MSLCCCSQMHLQIRSRSRWKSGSRTCPSTRTYSTYSFEGLQFHHQQDSLSVPFMTSWPLSLFCMGTSFQESFPVRFNDTFSILSISIPSLQVLLLILLLFNIGSISSQSCQKSGSIWRKLSKSLYRKEPPYLELLGLPAALLHVSGVAYVGHVWHHFHHFHLSSAKGRHRLLTIAHIAAKAQASH